MTVAADKGAATGPGRANGVCNPPGRAQPRIGSLFTGYGGLEMGVQAVLGGTVAWHSEVDPGACKILAHHYPDTPNLGDITAVDWSQVEPVDILTGGFPCQDVSTVGIRKGLRPGTRSGLWTHFAYAIDQLRPALVVIENVKGLLSANAHCDLERDCWCVGDERESPLRALGAVLGDLADLGYDCRWGGVRASDVGAPHQRFRVFIVAHPHEQHEHRGGDAGSGWWAEPANCGQPPADADLKGLEGRRLPAQRGGERPTRQGGVATGPGGVALLPTPTASRSERPGETETEWLERARRYAADGWADPTLTLGQAIAYARTKSDLSRSAQQLLPTPTAQAAKHAADDRGPGTIDDFNLWSVAQRATFGDYAPAVTKWEQVTRRDAPDPTTRGRLNPVFVEWMMGLPPGHVTDTPGLSHANQLKALGNGVVPQQATHALRCLL